LRSRLVLSVVVLAACGGGDPGHSHAADDIIARAPTAKERAELTRVRDDVDAAAAARIRELDAEIARLERENAALRK